MLFPKDFGPAPSNDLGSVRLQYRRQLVTVSSETHILQQTQNIETRHCDYITSSTYCLALPRVQYQTTTHDASLNISATFLHKRCRLKFSINSPQLHKKWQPPKPVLNNHITTIKKFRAILQPPNDFITIVQHLSHARSIMASQCVFGSHSFKGQLVTMCNATSAE